MNKTIICAALAASISTLPNLALAQQGNYTAPAPTYNYGKVYYFNQNVSNSELTLKGAGAEAEFLINDQIFVTGGYLTGDDTNSLGNKFKSRTWEGGVGTFHLVNSTTTLDLTLLGGQNKGDIDTIDYFSIRLGARKRFTEAFEVGAAYRFYDYSSEATLSSENTFEVFGKYHFDPNFSFDLKFNTFDFGNVASVGISYHF